MDGHASLQVDDRNDSKAHGRDHFPATPTILVHEWVTGGGMAGRPLPPSWAAEGLAMRRAVAREFAAFDGGRARVVVTLDARLADDPGPWTSSGSRPTTVPVRSSDLAREADFTVLIAPETTGILAGLTRQLQQAGARLLGSSARGRRIGRRQDGPRRTPGGHRDRHSPLLVHQPA